MRFEKRAVTASLILLLLAACSYDASQRGTFMKNYDRALAETDPRVVATLKRESAEEAGALGRFRDFYTVFSGERIRRAVRDLYAKDAYFRDGLREVRGIEEIERYFLSTTEAFEECTFDIQDFAVRGGDYYFRWVMTIALKRDRKDRFQVVGMSHVRFDRAGRVTFHQDYWDTGAIYERIPALGGVITWIRRRI